MTLLSLNEEQRESELKKGRWFLMADKLRVCFKKISQFKEWYPASRSFSTGYPSRMKATTVGTAGPWRHWQIFQELLVPGLVAFLRLHI